MPLSTRCPLIFLSVGTQLSVVTLGAIGCPCSELVCPKTQQPRVLFIISQQSSFPFLFLSILSRIIDNQQKPVCISCMQFYKL